MTNSLLPLILLLVILGAALALLKPYIEPTVFQIILVLLVAAVAFYVLLPLAGKVKVFSQSISLDSNSTLRVGAKSPSLYSTPVKRLLPL